MYYSAGNQAALAAMGMPPYAYPQFAAMPPGPPRPGMPRPPMPMGPPMPRRPLSQREKAMLMQQAQRGRKQKAKDMAKDAVKSTIREALGWYILSKLVAEEGKEGANQ